MEYSEQFLEENFDKYIYNLATTNFNCWRKMESEHCSQADCENCPVREQYLACYMTLPPAVQLMVDNQTQYMIDRSPYHPRPPKKPISKQKWHEMSDLAKGYVVTMWILGLIAVGSLVHFLLEEVFWIL